MQANLIVKALFFGIFLLFFACNSQPSLDQVNPVLLDPQHTQVNQKSPEKYQVKLETSKGPLVLEVERSLSPKGADRFYNLVQNNYYDDVRFHRVIPKKVVQFGINPHPKVAMIWKGQTLADEPVKMKNSKGTFGFAKAGKNTRTAEIYFNMEDQFYLDKQSFSPIGKIILGEEILGKFYSRYGELTLRKDLGVNPLLIYKKGNAYLKENFPKMDYIAKASVVK